MKFLYPSEKSQEIAEQVLARIEADALDPTPNTFEVLYTHFGDISPDVRKVIDRLDSNGKKLTMKICGELYKKYLSDAKESEQVQEAGDRIQQTIESVSSSVKGVKKASTAYGSRLSDATSKIMESDNPEEIQKILDSVVNDTQKMVGQNQKLEAELERSVAAVSALQEDFENMRKEALTDSLTGLSNRKYFDQEIITVDGQSIDSGMPYCLILMDIDFFKKFNDNFGHQVGDQVLRLVGKTLNDNVKGQDITARYGGEEFAILLPRTELNGAMRLADKLREEVQSKELVNRKSGKKMGKITVSGGVAQSVPGQTIDDLIERADKALYQAKENGRNQIATLGKKA